MRSRKAVSWLMTSSVSLELSRNCSNQRCVGLSRWLVGSSSIRTSGLDKQQMGQCDPHAVAARQLVHRTAEVRLAESQPGQNTLGFVLRILVAVRGIQHRFPGDGFELLRQIADAQARPLADRAFVRRFLAQESSEERGLAGAVGSDQADSRMRAQVRRGLHQTGLWWKTVYELTRFGAYASTVRKSDDGGANSLT